MKQKQYSHIKNTNKLLVSALMLGTLSPIAFANEIPTLDLIKPISESLIQTKTGASAPFNLQKFVEETTEPTENDVIVFINGEKYFYTPTSQQTDWQNLANTGAGILKEVTSPSPPTLSRVTMQSFKIGVGSSCTSSTCSSGVVLVS